MPYRPLTTAALAALVGVAAPVAWAQSAAAGRLAAAAPSSSSPAKPGEVRAWLMRIHEAASRRNFQGTFVVSGGGSVTSARIAHFCEGSNQFESSESLDGEARHVLRHNDLVYTVWPSSRLARIEPRETPAGFPALLQAGDDHIADLYDVMPERTDRVAGREADVLLVRPKDGHRYGYRFWADRASGLLLRADVLSQQGGILETSAFSEVTIGVRPQPDAVLQAIRKLERYRIVRPSLTPTALEVEGWSLARPAPGFRQVSCVRRPMDGASLGEVEADVKAGSGQVLQTIFSDGLTYVSVFIEPYDPVRHARPMAAVMGATQTLSRRQGDWWVTLVGDVPGATLKMFADALERKR